jgi:branched-chain amino acid transport system ATP-binding protein
MNDTKLLELRDISAGYESLDVLHHVDLEVHAGEIVSIIGASGAGKTSVLRVAAGILHPHAGTILMNGNSAGRWTWDQIGRGLVAYVPRGRLLFANQSVHANLLMGGHWYRKDKERLRKGQALVYQLFPALATSKQQAAGALSSGGQQMLAIGRAIMSDSTILVLDEPSAGLEPEVAQTVFTALSKLSNIGRSVLMAERRVSFALSASNRCYVMQMGRIAYSGPSSDLQGSPDTVAAYLGRDLFDVPSSRYGA